jgi:hypothetical protein
VIRTAESMPDEQRLAVLYFAAAEVSSNEVDSSPIALPGQIPPIVASWGCRWGCKEVAVAEAPFN